MSLHLHVQTVPSPGRQASPTPVAHDLLFEDEHPPQGWRVLFAVDPMTQERFASVWIAKDDPATDLIDCLQRRAEERLAASRTGPRRVG